MTYVLAWTCAFILTLVSGERTNRDVNDQGFKLVCYWDTASVSRKNGGKFGVSDIDSTLCTHLVVRSARLGDDGLLYFSSDFHPDDLPGVLDLKTKQKDLKILLSVDDLSESSRSYLKYNDFHSFEDQLLETLSTIFSNYDFDGIDLDISKPDIHGKTPQIKDNLVSVLKSLRSAMDGSGRLLTVLAAGDKETIDEAYDIVSIDQLTDFVNLKSFDYHGGAEKYAALNAPMYPRPDEQGTEKQLNVDWSVGYWLDGGGSRERLVLGTPGFGRTFTLKDPSQTVIGAPVIGYGKAGPYLLKAGIMAYNELCGPLANDRWSIEWEPDQETPYASKDNQWIGYDDVGSIGIKGLYASERGLAGAMFWTLDMDDFNADCGHDHFPLVKQLWKTLEDNWEKYQPNPEPHPFDPVCYKEGYFRNPTDCNKYYWCVDQGGSLTMFDFSCGPGTVFNEAISVCDWPRNVKGCQ